MLPACAVLDQAHHEAVDLVGVDDDGGDRFLLQLDESLQPPLAADEIVFRRFRFVASGDGDRTFQADLDDVLHHLFKGPAVADPRVEDADLFRRDQRDFFVRQVFGVVCIRRPPSQALARRAHRNSRACRSGRRRGTTRSARPGAVVRRSCRCWAAGNNPAAPCSPRPFARRW